MPKTLPGLLLIFMLSSLEAQEIRTTLTNIVSDQYLEALLQKGSIQYSSVNVKDWKFQLTPNTELAVKLVSNIDAKKYSVVIEQLNIYVKKKKAPKVDISPISRILRKISLLEGLEYYSTSKKKYRVLYEKSFVVKSKNSKERLSDPVEGSADGLQISVLQKDVVFGENVYTYSYLQNIDEVSFSYTNDNPLTYSLIKVIDKDDLHVNLAIKDFGEFLLVYAFTCADMASVPGLDNRIVLSFSTRAEAVYKWFITQYEQS